MATEGVSQLQAMQNVLRANRGLATGEDAPGQDTPVDDDIPDLAVGLEEEGVAVKTGKPRKRKEKLTEFAFLSSKGIPMLYEEFPRLSFSQERGHEVGTSGHLTSTCLPSVTFVFGFLPHALSAPHHTGCKSEEAHSAVSVVGTGRVSPRRFGGLPRPIAWMGQPSSVVGACQVLRLCLCVRLCVGLCAPLPSVDNVIAAWRWWMAQNHLRVMRGMEASRKLGDPVDEGALYEDAADRLMAMQPAEPSPEDDAMGVSSSVAGSMPQPNANAVFGAASTQQEVCVASGSACSLCIVGVWIFTSPRGCWPQPSRPAAPPAEPKFDDGDIEMNDGA